MIQMNSYICSYKMVHFDYIAVIATHVIIADIVMEYYTVMHGT